jgi:hypothetical protein
MPPGRGCSEEKVKDRRVIDMKVVEYIGEVLPDGHLSLPDEIQKKLGLSPHSSVRVTIAVEEPRKIDEKKGWEVFRQMGKNAASSGSSDVSTNHDHYLYGKKK